MTRGMVLVTLAVLFACASSKDFERGREAARAGDWDRAVGFYERAFSDDPENIEYRIAVQNARMEASRAHRDESRKRAAAGDLEVALEELEIAIELDPTNRYLHDELAELRARSQRHPAMPSGESGSPIFERERVLDPSSAEPIRLYFPEGTSLRKVLETLGKLAGVNILFDESFRDKQVSVDLDGVTFREALDILMQTNGLFYKVVGPSYVVTQ